MKPPCKQAQAHSSALCADIKKLIYHQGGKISFADFMQQALYAPGLGYYSSGAQKFGADGDFITAPELGCLFAKCLAEQCKQILTKLDQVNILEIGAGSGQLALDLLSEFKAVNLQIDNYFILELSADLRQRQQQKLAQEQVQWLNQLPSDFCGIIIGNEVLDAMPVHRFCLNDNNLQEFFVCVQNGGFAYILDQASPELERQFASIKHLLNNSPQYISEINLYNSAWINSLSDCLQKGAILLCDYGFNAKEYYHPQRNTGTLMCHYQHHNHTDPFFYPGLQDITAHVDFSLVANAANNCNLQLSGFTNLANFLLDCDLIKHFEYNHKRSSEELKILSSPAEMGELFKVICLTRGIRDSLLGFRSATSRRQLLALQQPDYCFA